MHTIGGLVVQTSEFLIDKPKKHIASDKELTESLQETREAIHEPTS